MKISLTSTRFISITTHPYAVILVVRGNKVIIRLPLIKDIKLKGDPPFPFRPFPFGILISNVQVYFLGFWYMLCFLSLNIVAKLKIIDTCHYHLGILKSICNISNIWIFSCIYSSCLIFS